MIHFLGEVIVDVVLSFLMSSTCIRLGTSTFRVAIKHPRH